MEFAEKVLNNSYKVDEEGYVNYSFVGKIKVKGLTINDAQKEIEELQPKEEVQVDA